MNRYVGSAHPNIYKAIRLLKRIESNTSVCFEQLKNGLVKVNRDKFDIDKDTKLANLINDRESNVLTIEEFINACSSLIMKKKPIKQIKYFITRLFTIFII